MKSEIKHLQKELQKISDEIYNIRATIENLEDEKEVLLKRKKYLQRQAIFYIEKLHNLRLRQ